ncbi:MAG: hypothetical protein CFE31_15250 [Rhizobiales bacterium PAR1]|nr:MAG: hypothetical protein CFE31_15250 [Rhizobiales bacterium PAR1]
MASLPVMATELLMVERDDCVWCRRWFAEVGPAYQNSDEGKRAPLQRFNLANGQPKMALKEPVRFTPTFILIHEEREVGRIVGYLDNAMFWGLLGSMLKRLDESSAR